MTYHKPEIAVLGDAATVIQGIGSGALETNKVQPRASGSDGDLDE